jgi:carbamoyl-phosphate synthase large subunit
MNILFVPVGRRRSLLEWFKKSKNTGDRLIGVDITDQVATLDVLDKFYTVPRFVNEGAFVSSLEEIISKEKVDLVVPLLDQATRLLIDYKQRIKCPVLSTSVSLNAVCRNKVNTSKFLGQHVLTPEVLSNLEEDKIVARKTTSSGSHGMCVLETGSQKGFFWETTNPDEYILTRYIEGREYTIDCFKDLQGNVLAIIPRERFEVRSGEVLKGRTVNDRRLIYEAGKLLKHMEFSGPICIQCIYDGKDYYFTEINDRFGGGVIMSFLAGADMPDWVIRMYKGEVVDPIDTFKEITVLRCDREIVYGG